MSSTIDKVKHALHMDKDKSATHSTGTAEGAHGPHSSRAANAADPRIDSDLDGSRNAGAHGHNTTTTGGLGHNTAGTHTGVGHNTTHTGVGSTGLGHTGPTSHNTSTAGPHNSDLLNKADPRVDSDRSQQTYGTHAQHNTTGTGLGGSHTGTGYNTGATGTHTGGHLGNTGTTGGISHSSNAGPHNSNLMNKADPTVDSDLDGRGAHGTHGNHSGFTGGSHATPGSGTAQNTAGPHNSDMLNKMDPRVDADLDGSKTFGGNKTHT